MTREKKKRGNGDDELGTKNIYPADAPTRHQYFSSSWESSKELHLPARCAVCQPEVNTVVDDLIWSDDRASRLALSQDGAGVNTDSEAGRHIQFIM